MIVVHDELDIPFGDLRLKTGGGHGGHNGVRDIAAVLGTPEFPRIRVGIGRPPGRQPAADFVLKDFTPTERKELPLLVGDAADAVIDLADLGLEAAQQRWNAPRDAAAQRAPAGRWRLAHRSDLREWPGQPATAIVTGGGSGIGAACATALAGAGWTVAVVGRRAEPLHGARERMEGIHAFPGDVTDEASVDEVFDAVVARFGRLDLLFNNAGRGGSPVEIDEVDVDEWREVVDLNVTGTFLCTRAAFRIMRAQDPQGGRIVNNGSISAQVPRPLSIAYTATKHAVTA